MNKFLGSTKQEEDPLIPTSTFNSTTSAAAFTTTTSRATAAKNTPFSAKDQLNPNVEAFIPIYTTRGTVMSTGTAPTTNTKVKKEQGY